MSHPLMDVLFEALDALTEMKEDLRSGSDTDIDVSALVAAIAEALDESQELQSSPVSPNGAERPQSGADAPEDVSPADQVAAAQETLVESSAASDFEEPLAHVTIKIDASAPCLRSARQIVDPLASFGEIVESVPNLDEIEAMDYDLGCGADGQDAADLEESVKQIADLAKVSVESHSGTLMAGRLKHRLSLEMTPRGACRREFRRRCAGGY